MTLDVAMSTDPMVTDDLRNHLLKPKFQPFGLDLPATNIQVKIMHDVIMLSQSTDELVNF